MSSSIKIFILGANSFSGQDFVDLALNNPDYELIGISRSKERSEAFLGYRLRTDLSHYRYYQFDLNADMDELLVLLDKERPNWVINFAAQSEVAPSWEFPEHWFQTNTVTLAKLINHLRRKDYLERYLHVSSPEAYGTCEGNMDEDTAYNPSTPYAASKAAADMLLSVYHHQYGFPLQTVRATNVYGARQQLFKIIPRAISCIRQKRNFQLHGGGVAMKSYIHIRDVSKGEMAILEKGELGEIYHLSPDNGISIKDLVTSVCNIMGVSFEDYVEIVAERPGQDKAYLLNSKKAHEKLGWQPEINLKDGLYEVVKWIERYWELFEAEQWEYIHRE
jgi:dTDP-glucose 4,6-dehydratase